MRIMAAMPQFPVRESNKQREIIRCQIKELSLMRKNFLNPHDATN
jgi:hypothetical protein